jgi:phosphoribosylaminoimidazole-succinocarboxamide synthase
VLPTEIPDKGRVLTGLSAFWFARTREIVPNHLLALRADGRSTECRRLEMLPLECVVRGYLTGSGWKDYEATGAGLWAPTRRGPARLRQAAGADLHARDEAQEGHDENIDRARAAELVGQERFDEVERVSLELYGFASASRGRARDPARGHQVRIRAR